MKKLVTSPLHLLWQALVLPLRLLVGSLGFTFRAGVSVGKLPIKGGAVVSRALGWKILGAVTIGVVIGFVLGRQVERIVHSRSHNHESNDLDDVDDFISPGHSASPKAEVEV